ncbi:MAG: C69 family dipeptidase [Acidobacteriota bacterium]
MSHTARSLVAALTVSSLALALESDACTTILIGKGLTADGSVIHAHNEDMGNDAVGRLWYSPRASHAKGERFSVPYVELERPAESLGYWASGNADGGVGLGTAAASRPYDSVLVGLNQHGVSMSCNWAHSREDNSEGVGIRRYAIRQLILERATSARHGVEIIGALIERYGQADWGGLIYNLADPEEAWVVETTTRQWAARRIRDDEIHVTANRFRIGEDYDLASASLVRHAVAKGWHESAEEHGSAEGPLDFSRVYGRPERMHEAYDTLREARALELLAPKRGRLRPADVVAVLRDRYDGTPNFAPPQSTPVWREDLADRPDLKRAISTNLTQSTFIAHLRGDLPVSIGAMMWYGTGTPTWTGYFPLYAGGGTVPPSFSKNDAASEDSAWSLFRRLQHAADRDFERNRSKADASWNRQWSAAKSRQKAIEVKAIELWTSGKRSESSRLLAELTSGEANRVQGIAKEMLGRIGKGSAGPDSDR